MNFLVNVIKKIEEYTTVFFFCASIFVMSLLLQALLLTWLSQFKLVYLSVSVIISSILTAVSFRGIKKDIHILPRVNIKVFGIIMLICVLGIFFPHETFGGRDEGSYSNAAVMLSKNSNLLFSSNIRTAVGNNPGEDTQKLVLFETPAYYVWLAIQNVFFGLGWMLRSNIIFASLGLSALFFVFSSISNKSFGFTAVALFSSSLPFLWFFRETMSENLAFFLLWTSLAFLMTFLRTKRNMYLFGLLLGTWLFSFTRLEGLLMQFTIFMVFSFLLFAMKIFSIKKNVLIIFVYVIVISSSLLIQKPFTSSSLLGFNIRKIDYLVKRATSGIQVVPNSMKARVSFQKIAKFSDRIPFFVFEMLAKYNFVIVLFAIFIILPVLVIDRRMHKTTRLGVACLLIVILPEFYKFIDPAVSLDQPWMYRRYLYALLPLGYFCFIILLNRLMNRKLTMITVVLLVSVNIILSRNIIFLKNNWSLTKQLDKIIKNISPSEDLVIVYGWTVLDNYYPTSYLNYQKGIRAKIQHWSLNTLWLPEEHKYNGLFYKHLFLLSDKGPENFKQYNFLLVDSIEVQYNQLQPNCILSTINNELGLPGDNLYSLPYSNAVTYCSKVYNDILQVKKRIYLYEMIM